MTIHFSPKAISEINAIYKYLFENFGEKVADEKKDKIHDYIDKLADNPFMGHSIDGKDKNLRLLSVPPCVVVYDINDQIIEIVHIVDARTDYIKNLLLNQ